MKTSIPTPSYIWETGSLKNEQNLFQKGGVLVKVVVHAVAAGFGSALRLGHRCRESNVKTQTPPHPTAEFSAILHVRQLYFPYLEDLRSLELSLQFTAPGRESFPETVCFVLLEVHFHHTC